VNKIKKIEVDLKREISFIINSKINDPRLGFVTITGVRLSTDYNYLDVFVSIMGSDKIIKDTLIGLNKSSGFIKKNLRERVKLRNMPRVKFIIDDSIDTGMKITKILEDLKKSCLV
jgi:ribosome-binding factor A